MQKKKVQLIISEKPKTAQKIAAALSANYKVHNLHGVNYFELEKGGMKVYVAPAVGHVYTLAQKEKGSGYPVFDIEWRASSEVSDSSDFTKKYLQVLLKLGKEASELVSATDYDIEGSLIAGNIINHMAKGKNAKRMLFSTLTEEDLREAYANAGPLDVTAIEAGEARHMLDFYWGINCSRALMHALRSAGRFKVLSIGRVQGPALALLAHKEREIAKFKPEKYSEIHARIKKTDFLHEKGRFFDAKGALEVFSECSAQKSGTVEKTESRKFKQLQPVPFDLTTMQVEAYRNFGMSPTRTLQVAQSLYEGAYISYPRTSSQKLPEKLGLGKIIAQIGRNPAYSKFASELILQNRLRPHEGAKTDSAHVSIYPTGQIASKLSKEEGNLYDLIVKRFLSAFAPEAKRESMKVSIKIASHIFIADGTRTIEEGWFAFYRPYLHLEEVTLPEFTQGERVAIEKIEKLEKETQPPRRYTPASIIRELERQNLGTKATRSVVVDTLFNRGYLTDKKSIKVTPFGMAIFEALSENVPEITNEALTREFEESVEKIERGERKGSDVVEEGRKALLGILAEFKENEEKIGKGLLKGHDVAQKNASILGKCGACKTGDLQIRKSRFGFFVGCSSYPNCKNLYPLPKNALIEPKNTYCKVCGVPEIKVIRKGKRPFEMCINTKCESKASWGKKDFKKKEWTGKEKPQSPV
ncbi:MAG: DNA topoisomerase I [Candidatus Micrarchaeota archaeon]